MKKPPIVLTYEDRLRLKYNLPRRQNKMKARFNALLMLAVICLGMWSLARFPSAAKRQNFPIGTGSNRAQNVFTWEEYKDLMAEDIFERIDPTN